jgi:hypothetical protein
VLLNFYFIFAFSSSVNEEQKIKHGNYLQINNNISKTDHSDITLTYKTTISYGLVKTKSELMSGKTTVDHQL